MADETDIHDESIESPSPLLGGLRRVLMAGIGAVALAQEETEDFVNKMVERGEIADGDARKLVNDVVEKRKKVIQDKTKKTEDELDQRLERLLARMNIPSKSEIDSLSDKISELSRKVDQLKTGK